MLGTPPRQGRRTRKNCATPTLGEHAPAPTHPFVLQFLDRKNKANKANMELHMEGASDSMLTRLLRGLSGAKVTKTGTFRASDGVSPYLGCSYRNDAGAYLQCV
jgi:hypothetical protein